MTDAISGRFDYNSLKSTLRKKGVKSTDMYEALKQVAVDNNIKITDIKNLDDKKEIKISESIFNKGQTDNSSNISPMQAISNPFFLNADNQIPFLVNGKKVDFDDTDKLPEVYNDDEYEVVDYDDFYNFGENNDIKAQTMEYKISLEGPQKEGDPNPTDPKLMQLFNENSPYNQTVSGFKFNNTINLPFVSMIQRYYADEHPEILAMQSISQVPQTEKNYSTEVDNKDKEDLLEGAMEMDMDMSGNTFNA